MENYVKNTTRAVEFSRFFSLCYKKSDSVIIITSILFFIRKYCFDVERIFRIIFVIE